MNFRDKVVLSIKAFYRMGHKTKSTVAILVAAIVIFNVVVSLFNYVASSSESEITHNESLRYIQVESVSQELDYEDLSAVRSLKGVETAFWYDTSLVQVEAGDKGFSTMLLGVDTVAATALMGQPVELGLDEVILNSDLEDNGVKVGDKVAISYNVAVSADQGIRKTREVTVKGFVDELHIPALQEGTGALANEELVMQIKAEFYNMDTEDFLQSYTSSILYVMVSDVNDINTVAQNLETRGYLTGYSLKSAQGLPLLAKIIALLGTIIFIALIVFGGINAASLISQSIRSRYRHIGIFKSMGYSSRDIFELFFLEVVYIWLISVFISLLITVISMKAINLYVQNYIWEGISIPVTGWQLLISVVIVLVAICLASIFNIAHAAKLNPVDCLRSE